MLVTWNWLQDYVALDMTLEELEQRLSMSGLNHESSQRTADDIVIDLEVTSNRPDCLGHLGVAREIAVLWNQPLTLPEVAAAAAGESAEQLTSVEIRCPELCPRYTARIIRGVQVRPSPDWLAERLEAIGVASVNNIVDATNYVMMETGQPLHAFDFARLAGQRIIVRDAEKGEQFEAIDHRTYTLEPGMCVIGDARRAVALGGVMGGADSEVSDSTTDLLIEAADFAPLAIRNTARRLSLFSPSSYRFERGVDAQRLDWASRRCCQLILETAGGQLAPGVVDQGTQPSPAEPIVLRLSQLPRILGIEIPAAEVARILTALGGEVTAKAESVHVVPPSWRRDLTREIDLVEEVARIHGYEEIPEDVGVPMTASHRDDTDRVLATVRTVLTAAGYDEALTSSVVSGDWNRQFDAWSPGGEPLRCEMPMLKGADELRLSLLPSLIHCRAHNQALGNPEADLFETARIYLPQSGNLPREQATLAIVSGDGFERVKGVVESLLDAVHAEVRLEIVDWQHPLVAGQPSCVLKLQDQLFGFLGVVAPGQWKALGLRAETAIAEVDLGLLGQVSRLVPQYEPQSTYPSMSRDINLVLDEAVRWADLAETVTAASGPLLESLAFCEIFRDPQRDGAGKKRLMFSITLRSDERTLTGEEVDGLRDQVVAACRDRFGAVLA